MKKGILITLVLIAALFTSCSEEGNTSTTEEKSTNVEPEYQDTTQIDTIQVEVDSVIQSTSEILAGRADTLYSIEGNWNHNTQLDPTLIHFENFKIKINSMFGVDELGEDTMLVYEDVGEYLNGREFTILPKNKEDTFHLYVRTINDIFEMMDSDSLGLLEDWETWDQFRLVDTSKRYYWKPLSNNKYIFPSMGFITSEKMKELKFSDTTYWYHGEMSGTYFGTAHLFDGHIVDYYIYNAFVIIERHNHGLKETKVLKIEFSYGC